jgi:hypothetical protein
VLFLDFFFGREKGIGLNGDPLTRSLLPFFFGRLDKGVW